MKRRAFVKGAGIAAAASTLAAPAVAQQRIEWNMVMPWPKGTPGVGVNAERFAQRVAAMSDGRITIRIFGAGELVSHLLALGLDLSLNLRIFVTFCIGNRYRAE